VSGGVLIWRSGGPHSLDAVAILTVVATI
jgi:hypothetical protein